MSVCGGGVSGCDYSIRPDSHGDSNPIDKLYNYRRVAKVYINVEVSTTESYLYSMHYASTGCLLLTVKEWTPFIALACLTIVYILYSLS